MMRDKPLKLALLGANGQIASEVALYLADRQDVELRGFTRSRYGTVLLDLAGIPSAVINFSNVSDENRALLSDMDAVIDCTFPAGQAQTLAGMVEANAAAVMKCMKPDAVFIHSSSISAFGMPIDSTELRNHKFARTSYARIKRSAEKRISRCGRRHGIRVSHLRLGQVHGVLQSVTRQFRSLIAQGRIRSTGQGTSLSTTVFCHSVAEAYVRAARAEFPDSSVTTVVSDPQWTLETLFDVYRDITSTPFSIEYLGASAQPTRRGLAVRLIRAGTPFRSVLESQVLPLVPGIAPRLKGMYRMHATERERRATTHNGEPDPLFHLVGRVPGRVSNGIKSSPEESIAAFRQIEALLAETLNTASV